MGDLRDGTTTFENCVFNGKFRGRNEWASETDHTIVNVPSRTTKWGGFVGWVADDCTAIFRNCLFNPTEINISSTSGSRTYARRDGTVNITNGFYTRQLGSADGLQTRSITGDEHVSVEITNENTGTNIFGTVFYGINNAVKYDGRLYSGNGNTVMLYVTLTDEPDPLYNGFMADHGTLTGPYDGNSLYQLTMPNEDVIISRAPSAWGGDGSMETPYLIYTAEQWDLLAQNVNNGTSTYSDKYFKLMADIMVDETINSNGTPIKMVGCSESKSFRGTFDGNGHTITLNLIDNSSKDFCAPFRYVFNATIKNLHVTGYIYKEAGKKAAGIVGRAYSSNNIINCRSSVDILSNTNGDGSHGGIVGDLTNIKHERDRIVLTNCLFDGKLRTINNRTKEWGGLIGWVTGETVVYQEGDTQHTEYSTAYINNCLFAPKEVDINSSGSKTLVRYGNSEKIFITNCYYKTLINDQQGAVDASSFSNEPLCAALLAGWEIFNDTVSPIMGRHTLTGQGTAALPYQINSVADWHAFASNVYLGETYSGKYIQLNTAISTSRMVGAEISSEDFRTFNGTFDGTGDTLNVTLNSSANHCAPFSYTYGATIKNLVTTGTINTAAKFASGVVGRNGTQSLMLNNVKSDVEINSTYNGNAQHGGLVGWAIQANITGCAFTGSLKGVNSTGCGGLLGYKTNEQDQSRKAIIKDCLFAPANVTVNATNAYTLANNSTGGVVEISNSYYKVPLGTVQGKLRHSITATEHVIVEGYGTFTHYPVSTIIGYQTGIMYDSVLYAGSGEVVSLNLGAEENYIASGFSVDHGTLEGSSNPYTLTMPNEDVTISAELLGIIKFISGYANSTNPDGGYVLIASPVGAVNPVNVDNLFVNEYDLYRFNQATDLEWENYKANTFDLETGKGYLYSNSEDVTLVFSNTPYTGNGEVTLSKSEGVNFAGWNLVGNPFAKTAYIADGRSFYTMNGEGTEIMAAETNSISPMGGVFVIANEDGETMTFTTSEPDNNGKGIALNLSKGGPSTLRQAQGSGTAVIDRAIISFGEGRQLPKLQIDRNSTKVYITQDNIDYAVVKAKAQGELPVSFKAEESGTYTISVNVDKVEMNYLHLIDNLTGADVDLLAAGPSTSSGASYTFTTNTTDDANRFKLVFSVK